LDSNPFVCKNITNSFIAIYGFTDIFNNGYGAAAKIYGATEFIANTAPLQLQSFDFLPPSVTGDANNVLIKLYFSRRVNIASFSCSDFWFLSDRLATFSMKISNGDCTMISTTDDSVIQFTISSSLISGSIGASQDSTYIATYSGTLTLNTIDVYGNGLLAIDKWEAIQAGPRVVRFSTDMNTGIVLLILSSPILAPPLGTNVSLAGFFTIAASVSSLYTSIHSFMQSDDSTTLTLFNPLYHTNAQQRINGSILELRLSNSNLNRLKMLEVAPDNLYLLIDHQLQVTDSYGQYLCPINYPFERPSLPSAFINWGQLRVSRFVGDDTQPFLQSIKLDLGEQTLSFQFDEPIRPSSVTVAGVRIQQFATISQSQDSSGTYNYLRLSSNAAATKSVELLLVDNSKSAEIVISLTTADATTLKLRPGLAKNVTSTFISIEYGSMADFAGNFFNAIGPSHARELDVFIPDTIRPQLLSFLVDMSSNEDVRLVLTFSEPVLSGSLRLDNDTITLQSRYFSLYFPRYTITGGVVSSSDGIEQTIHLLAEDVAAIKKIAGLMRTKQSTYMIISHMAVTDLAGNHLIPYVDGLALACKTYIPDIDPPRILSTELDWNKGTLLLSLTEPVNLTAVYFPGLTFQSKIFSSRTSYSLTSTSSSVSHAGSYPLDDQVIIILGAADLNSIRSRYPLCATHENSWISFTSLFLRDFVGNYIHRVAAETPLLVSAYFADITRPTMLRYEQDMQNGKVYLTFSESVKTTSVNLSQIVQQNDTIRRFGVSIALNGSQYTVGSDAASIQMVITFSESILNYLKFYGIGYAPGYTFLSWSDTFVSDNSGNGLAPTWDSSVVGFRPREPDYLISDITSPTLLRWFKFTSSSGDIFIKLYFDEPVEFLHSNALSIMLTFTKGSEISSSPPLPLSSTNVLSEYVTLDNFNTILTVKMEDFCVVATNEKESVAYKSFLANAGISYRCSEVSARYSMHNSTLNSNTSTHQNGGQNATSSGLLFSYFLSQNISSSISYSLLVNSSAFRDYSQARNQITTTLIAQSYPDCSLCPAGQFVAVNCTSHTDRVCSPCTACGEGYYPQSLCGLYNNYACVVCASCRYGTYISSACSNSTLGANTQCSQCKECSALEYPTRDCGVGLDRLCESCLFCKLPTHAAKSRCERNGKYQSWYRNNCCFDNAGNQVNCNDVDLRNMLLTDISGRHKLFTHPL